MSDFNPYREWLGLESVQNPCFFELLGVDVGESDSDKIQDAAKKQLAKVRAVRPGEHLGDWTRVIDELNEARQTLCDPARRESYLQASKSANLDRNAVEVESNLASSDAPAGAADIENDDESVPEAIPVAPPVSPVSPPLSEAEPQDDVEEQISASLKPADAVQVRAGVKRRKKKPWKILVIGHLVIIVLGILFAGWLFSNPDRVAKLRESIGMLGGAQSSNADSELPDEPGKSNGKENQSSDPNNKNGKGDSSSSKMKDKETKKKAGKNKVDQTNDKKSGKENGIAGKGFDKSDPGKKLDPDNKEDAQGKKPDSEKFDYATLSDRFRFYSWLMLRSLEFRRFDLAKKCREQLETSQANLTERTVYQRLEQFAKTNEAFWISVERFADRVAGGQQVTIPNREEPIGIVEASRQKVVFRAGGENRRYETRRLPNLIAQAFASLQSGNGSTEQRLQLAVFLATRFERGVSKTADSIRLLNSLKDETEEAEPIQVLLQDDLSHLIVSPFNSERPDRMRIENRIKELNVDGPSLAKSLDWTAIDDAISESDPVERLARLRWLSLKFARAGISIAADLEAAALIQLEEKNADSVASIVAAFRSISDDKGETEDFIEKILSQMADDTYTWSKLARKNALKKLLSLAEKADLPNQRRKVQTLLDAAKS